MSKVVYFFKGSTCAPCKAFEPVFDNIVGDKLVVKKETDNAELMAQFGIRVVPSVVMTHVLPNGKFEVECVLAGAVRSKTLEDAVHRFIVCVPDSERQPNF